MRSVFKESKYPSAKPGALVCEPLKAARRGREPGPTGFEPPRGGGLSPKVELVPALVFLLLLPDVLANHGLFAPHRGHPKSSCPKVLAYEIPLPLSVHPRQMDRALPLDLPQDWPYRVLGRNRNHPMHMIWPQMPFFNLTLLLLCQPTDYFPKILAQFLAQALPTTFRNENYGVLALPLRMV